MSVHSIWESLVQQAPPIDSAVDFPTRTRFHMALNVKDVEALVPFYQAFLGKQPDLVRDGYAKFETQDPPFNISLNRVVHNAAGHGRFGFQVKDHTVVQRLYQRLEAAKLNPIPEGSGDRIERFTVTDPEANRWRIAAAS